VLKIGLGFRDALSASNFARRTCLGHGNRLGGIKVKLVMLVPLSSSLTTYLGRKDINCVNLVDLNIIMSITNANWLGLWNLLMNTLYFICIHFSLIFLSILTSDLTSDRTNRCFSGMRDTLGLIL